MRSIRLYTVSLIILLTFVEQILASTNFCLDFYSPSNPYSKIRKQGTLLGQPLDQIKKLEAQKISQIVSELKSKKIDYELVNHGDLFTSIIIKPMGTHDLSKLAQLFLNTRDGLKLILSPIFGIVLKDNFGAGYFGFKDLIFPAKPNETANKDLIMLSDAIRTEHAMIVNPDFIDKLKIDSPLVRHELDHARIESERKKNGADERAIRGQYANGFKGFSYHGELNMEEAYVWLGDIVEAAKGIKGKKAPKFLTQDEILKLNTADVPAQDSHRLAIIQFRGELLRDYGTSITEAAQSFFTNRPNDIRFEEWKNQVWALFTLKVPNTEGTTSDLFMRIPLTKSNGLNDSNNLKLLEKSVYDLYQTGTAFNNLGQIAYGVLESFKAGQDLFFYPHMIKYLQRIQYLKDLKDFNGDALSIDQIMERIQN